MKGHRHSPLTPTLLSAAGMEPLPQGGGCGVEVSADGHSTHVTCLTPSPFPAEAWVGALWPDAAEALLDPSWDILLS